MRNHVHGPAPGSSISSRGIVKMIPASRFRQGLSSMLAVVKAVSEAPPPSFSGGGKWEAMHGGMKGFYEVRVDGPDRRHYRLFCVLERKGQEVGLGGPSIVLIAGRDKPFRTKLSESDYEAVSRLGEEYRKRRPRCVAP